MWKYGDAGDRWPLAHGDIVLVGDTLHACGDLAGGECGATWLKVTHVATDLWGAEGWFVYVDPPWNDSLTKGFRTKAGVPHDGLSHERFLQELLALMPVGCRVYMEGSLGQAPRARLAKAAGNVNPGIGLVRQWPITYYGDKPAALYLLVMPGADATWLPDLDGMDDEDTPYEVCRRHEMQGDRVVLDPCAGRGLTGRAARATGLRAVLHELHPRRLAVAVEDAVKATGEQPRKRTADGGWVPMDPAT